MAKYFDEKKWDEALQHGDWYLRVWDELKVLMKRSGDIGEGLQIKEELRDYFLQKWRSDSIPLADTGDNLDEERQAIDTIVIHHTSNTKPYTLERMNVVQLLNVYVPYFANPTLEQEKHLKGMPIWSNHVRDGKPVFWAYHWLVRRDGVVERLLSDDEIGWHAGNWDINTRSVAICLDNDYEESTPSDSELAAVAAIIKDHYPGAPRAGIIGHREANPKATCPGNLFMSQWKGQLLQLLP